MVALSRITFFAKSNSHSAHQLSPKVIVRFSNSLSYPSVLSH